MVCKVLSEHFSAGRHEEHMHVFLTLWVEKKRKKERNLLTAACEPGLKQGSAYLAVWSVHITPVSLFTLDNH